MGNIGLYTADRDNGSDTQIPRDSRSVVAENMLSDLATAAEYLPSRGPAAAWTGRVNKETAMMLAARIALYEGTWEKYHAGTVFGVAGSDGTKFLTKAKEITDALIALGICDLDNIGAANGYAELFNKESYKTSKEVLFWREYKLADGNGNWWSDYSTYGARTGLINAEAKAELGTITQADIDNTINKLRRRLVGMADMKLADVNALPASSKMFPALSNIINEVRRERTVELAAEGFRVDDIFRWAAADILIRGYVPQGAKLAQWEGITDAASRNGFKNAVDALSVDAQGYIAPYGKQTAFPTTGYNFNLGRDYLNPLPSNQLTLFTNLKQNPGW